MMVKVNIGRCACGAMETVTYAQQIVRDETGRVRSNWMALVSCVFCGKERRVVAERITDFVLTIEAEATEEEDHEEDQDVLPDQPRG